MPENKSILHELYVFSEWKPEPEYIQKSDSILPEKLSSFWRWIKFFGPKKSLIDSITAYKERHQKWHIALGDEGKVIAVLTDNILEIRTKRSDYATIAARTTVSRDAYPQWRKLVWSPDCSFVVIAYGNGIVSFFDLTASNLFNIPTDCSRTGGLECTDNTHAVADIIFMPLRVKDNKWNSEVVIVTYDGKLRGYLVSHTEGFKLQHTFAFPGGVSALVHSAPHATLFVAGLPIKHSYDPSSPLTAGITAWRILNDDPFYTLSVVSDQLETHLGSERFRLYIPFLSSKNMAFIVRMVLSPDNTKLVCLHFNGDISIWRLPLLKLIYRWPLNTQPQNDLRNPLVKEGEQKVDSMMYYPADTDWWSNEEIILSRFSGAVSICNIENMMNILGKKPEFLQGSPQVTRGYDGTFMALECESNVLPAKRRSDESMEVVKVESAVEDSMLELTKELFKSVLYAFTDMETFQPRPKRITIVSRIYRLLGVKSTTPEELFTRKIESSSYSEALTLAKTFNLDSDLVYQQQWRKNPVSTEAIHNYLSKVSKKIWAVHQCVDRLPETMPAAKDLLQFGLTLTNIEIMHEINKERIDDKIENPDDITLQDLNAYTSELLRCRHVMLFYKERLKLYEAILKCEKSTYVKDEYDRLRSNSIVHSAIETAKEGRIQALTCLWPNIKTIPMQLAVLENLPETINPLNYQHLLPTKKPMQWFEKKSPIKIKPSEYENDWCRKEIFRSIWNSNWSEDTTPESETSATMDNDNDIATWYEKRAREIEGHSGLVSHALTLITLATVGGGVEGLDKLMFNLLTLDTLVYDINVEGVTLKRLERTNILDTCSLLMKMSTHETFVSDLKKFVIPFLKRYENLTKRSDACLSGLTDYLESVSVDDLSYILLVLKSPSEFELDVRTHLELAERCIYAYIGTDQLDKACEILDTVLKESDGSISEVSLVRRVSEAQRVVWGCNRMCWRDVRAPPQLIRQLLRDPHHAAELLHRLARCREDKYTQQDWEKLLKDILELQSNLFTCVPREECYEIYASALLTSGDSTGIRLASEVLTCHALTHRNGTYVNYKKSVELVSKAAREYFNSASSLTDPALDLARCCLTLIKDDNDEIQQELNLISALQILSAFGLTLLPVQVRLCEDKMTLIDSCLKADPNAYMASHKLLKLAKLLKIGGDDEKLREACVLERVCENGLEHGDSGAAGVVECARRLAALRCAPSAARRDVLWRVADRAPPHCGTPQRRQLYAAALALCAHTQLHHVLRQRMNLELEDLRQRGTALKEHLHLDKKWPSTDDEFADAVTTPVIEKKDLVASPKTIKKIPIVEYFINSFQNKPVLSEPKTSAENDTVQCIEFYHTLYPEHAITETSYRYDRFSLPEECSPVHAALRSYYLQNAHNEPALCHLEPEVLQKCGAALVNTDTALSVACTIRAAGGGAALSRTALSAALYAALVRCNNALLRDQVYLTAPAPMMRLTLKQNDASEEEMEIIRQSIDKLNGLSEVEKLRELGYDADVLLFIADEDYRREIVYRIARTANPEHVELACALGVKHGTPPLDVWLQYYAASPAQPPALDTLSTIGLNDAHAYTRIKDEIWPLIQGEDHNSLINFFNLLKNIDEKPIVYGLTAAEHIKLLKKAKAVSPELDYKLLLNEPSLDAFSEHIMKIIKPENVGLLVKFLRGLPSIFRVPMSGNAIYTKWLTQLLFSVPESSVTSKKWMQQYRECTSYFNKLTKEGLLEFVANTCFSDEAVQRIPFSTRNLMIMQAVDYCHQEQENDVKTTKNEQTWSQVGQELSKWARFLETFHSSTVQAIIDKSNVPRDDIWTDIEKSHGDSEKIISNVSRLVLETELRSSTLISLQCLHVSVEISQVLEYIVQQNINDSQQIQTLVSRIMDFNKEGIKLSEDFLERVISVAIDHGLPPHRLIGLLSLCQRHQAMDSSDMVKVAQFSLDLLKAEWPETVEGLSDEKLLTEEGRREVFSKYLPLAVTWKQKKALAEIVNCWPLTKSDDSRSLQCELVHHLLSSGDDKKENLEVIKLLLRQPVLVDEEVKYLLEKVKAEVVINAIWVAILSNCENRTKDIVELALRHKEFIQNQDIEDDLIKELLDKEMLIPLVPTSIYSSIVNYILTKESLTEEDTFNVYTVEWAVSQLVKHNYLAEASNLHVLSIGLPTAFMHFSVVVMYSKNLFKTCNQQS